MGKQNTGDETLDTLLGGRLSVIQSKAGYRFSLDAVLLGHFAAAQKGDRVLDLGTGNGVVALILAAREPALKVVGLEIQAAMAERAARSAALNCFGDRVAIVRGDVRAAGRIFPAASFDAAVCNPPYRRAASGRTNPNGEKRVARHEIEADLGDFVSAAARLLRRGGALAVIYPATRLTDLIEAMREERLEPKRLRLVYSFEDGEASLVMAEGIKEAGAELKVMAPLVVYTKERTYTPEASAILAGRYL